MKYLLILVATLTLVSCKKQEGYMFEAFHRIKSDHNRHCSDFFEYSENDEAAALKFYNSTRPWDPNMIEIDSTWVKYHCTAEEWRKKSL